MNDVGPAFPVAGVQSPEMTVPVWTRLQLTVIGVVPTLDATFQAPETSAARAVEGASSAARITSRFITSSYQTPTRP